MLVPKHEVTDAEILKLREAFKLNSYSDPRFTANVSKVHCGGLARWVSDYAILTLPGRITKDGGAECDVLIIGDDLPL